MVAGAIGIVAASLTSALTMSSPQGMWSVLNQFQTLTFLLLTRAYFPEETSGSFTGLSQITNFSFDFMPFPNLDFLSGFLSWFNLPTPGNISSKLGLKSGSTFFNNISLFLNILIVVFIHIIFIIVKRLLNKRLDKRPIIKAIVERIYRLFTLCLYLRLIMEAYQFLLICSCYEIYSFRSATNADIVSLAIAFMVFVLCIIFAKAVLALTIKEAKGVNDAKNTQDDKKSIFCELFDGTKDTKYSKYYSFMFIIRKALIIIFMAFLTDLNIIIKVAFFVLVQLLYFLYIVSVRPLEKMKDNLIGVMNEALMLLLASMLFKFNQESDWTSPSKMVFFLSISIVNLLVSIICIVDLIIILIKGCINLKNKIGSKSKRSLNYVEKIENREPEVVNNNASFVSNNELNHQKVTDLSRSISFERFNNMQNLEKSSPSINQNRPRKDSIQSTLKLDSSENSSPVNRKFTRMKTFAIRNLNIE